MPDTLHAQGMVVYSEPGHIPLFFGDGDREEKKITLISGQNLKRGALLGRITASGKWTLALAAAGDGSQVPRSVLAVDTDATSGDHETITYIRADVPFNEGALTLGTGIVLDTATRDALQVLGLTFKPGIGP